MFLRSSKGFMQNAGENTLYWVVEERCAVYEKGGEIPSNRFGLLSVENDRIAA